MHQVAPTSFAKKGGLEEENERSGLPNTFVLLLIYTSNL